MTDFSIWAFFRGLISTLAKLSPIARRLHAERWAGRNPYSVPFDHGEPLLDGALKRLGAINRDDPYWKVVGAGAGGLVVRPDEFRKPHIREWLSRYEVTTALKTLTRAAVVGAPTDRNARRLLLDSYSNVSGEDQHHAEAIVDTAVAFLKASLQGTAADAGTAGLVQAGFSSVHQRFDALAGVLSLSPTSPDVTPEPPPVLFDIGTVQRAFGVVSRMLLGWPQETDGHWIERPELERLRALALQSEPAVMVLVGPPGEGKSAILARLGTQLASVGTILLAIKADQVPRKVGTLADLDAWVDCTVPVAEALRRMAAERRVVLLIDQLDALADLMDQHSERLSALLRLVDTVRDTPNLQVLLSCREFEFRNDVRLNTLKSEAVTLGRPTWEQVLPLITARGLDAHGWSDEVRDVLRTPQHVALFLTHLAGRNGAPAFVSYWGLLDRVVRERLERRYGVRTVEAAERIAAEMAQEEELWLARDRFEREFSDELKKLIAGEFLVLSENGLGLTFRHQTLFDFLRARAFLRGRLSLAEHVIAEKQASLFVRPILWSALHYIRGGDRAAYRREFRRLWAHEGLRLHLRYLLLTFLGQVPAPDDEEAGWLLPTLDNPALRARTLRAMIGSAEWFARIRGRLPSLMLGPPAEAWETIGLLSRATTFERGAVLRLVEQCWLASDSYLSHALRVFYDLEAWDESSVEIVAKFADRAPGDSFSIRHIAAQIAKSRPDLAPEVVARYLRARTNKIAANPTALPKPPAPDAPDAEQIGWRMRRDEALFGSYEKLIDNTTDWHDVDKLAIQAPKAFIERAWPWLVDILEQMAHEPHPFLNEYRRHRGLTFLREKDERERHPLPNAFEVAIRGFAEMDSEAFLGLVEANKGSDLMVVHHLLALGLERIAVARPQAVHRYLLEDPRRLAIGDMHDTHRNSRALISAVAPVLADGDALRLEQAIVGWQRYRDIRIDEDRKTRFERRKWLREHRLRLLRSFPPERLSPKTRRHLVEEERALPHAPDYDLGHVEVGWVGSSMSAVQMAKATDDEIVALFEELIDSTEWEHPKRRWNDHVGGSIQASRAFADFAKSAPDRALRIIERFQPGTQERPAGAALAALGDSGLSPATLIAQIRKLDARGFASDEFRADAANCLRQIARRAKGLDDATCHLLEGWIKDWKPPACHQEGKDVADYVRDPKERRDAEERFESLLWGHGQIEILPHGNYPLLDALMLGYLLRDQEGSDDWLGVLERHIARDEDPKVWCALANHLQHLIRADRRRSIGFFESLFARYPEILRTTAGVRLIGHIQDWIPSDMIGGILDGWISNMWTRGPQAAGELATLKLCRNPNESAARRRVERFLTGGDYAPAVVEGLRLGIAHTLVAAWREPTLRSLTTPLLVRLVPVADGPLARALHAVFGSTDPMPADGHTHQLLEALLDHPSILGARDGVFVLDRLKQLLRDGGIHISSSR